MGVKAIKVNKKGFTFLIGEPFWVLRNVAYASILRKWVAFSQMTLGVIFMG